MQKEHSWKRYLTHTHTSTHTRTHTFFQEVYQRQLRAELKRSQWAPRKLEITDLGDTSVCDSFLEKRHQHSLFVVSSLTTRVMKGIMHRVLKLMLHMQTRHKRLCYGMLQIWSNFLSVAKSCIYIFLTYKIHCNTQLQINPPEFWLNYE